MLLLIDTTDNNGLYFALIPDGNNSKKLSPVETKQKLSFNENFKTLALLEKFLKTHKVLPANLQKIIVCSGPGSFTGIRVGIAMAQAMGFALDIPVIATPKEKIPTSVDQLVKLWKIKSSKKLTLNYGREPNITLTKKSPKNSAKQKRR